MREALAGLTVRGRSLVAAGAAAAVSAVALGERDLLRVAVLLVLLPPLSAAAVALTRYRLSCHRTVEPERVQVGDPARVVLQLRNVSRLPTGVMLLEDTVPPTLGDRPRFALGRLWPRQGAGVAYTVRAEARGRYRIGPLAVRLTDLFGLCEVTRTFANSGVLTVTPVIHPLRPVSVTGEAVGTGESRTVSAAVHGEHDAAIREYRRGDDLRTVHWRSTAHVGELMVRREEQPRHSRAAVLLDTRTTAHRGEGATSSLEWAVSAAASIALHLSDGGYALRLLTDAGADLDVTGPLGAGAMLDHLAEVRPSRRAGLDLPAQVLRRTGGGLLVAVLGGVDPAEVTMLGKLRDTHTTCVAIMLRVSDWGGRGAPDEGAAASLAHAGWHVVPAYRDSALGDVWARTGYRPLTWATR